MLGFGPGFSHKVPRGKGLVTSLWHNWELTVPLEQAVFGESWVVADGGGVPWKGCWISKPLLLSLLANGSGEGQLPTPYTLTAMMLSYNKDPKMTEAINCWSRHLKLWATRSSDFTYSVVVIAAVVIFIVVIVIVVVAATVVAVVIVVAIVLSGILPRRECWLTLVRIKAEASVWI